MASISELIHGRKPEVAPFIPTDPLEELQKLLRGEITSWDEITQLSDLFQTYMLGAYEKAIPGFQDILKQGGADTASLLQTAEPLTRGEVPEDVAKEVFRRSAFLALGAGTLGGPMGTALAARNLGLTSLDLINQGANLLNAGGNAAQRWQQIASGTILPPSSQLYSPEWFSNFRAQQRAAKQATKQLKYNVEAAPDPAWAERAQLLASYGGMALGGAMGGMGGPTGATGAGQAGGAVGQGYNFGAGYSTPAPAPVPAPDYKTMIPPQTYPVYFNQAPINQTQGAIPPWMI